MRRDAYSQWMMRLTLVLICFFHLSLVAGYAQESGDLRLVYTQAEEDYEIGRLEKALETLEQHVGEMEGNLKKSSYRLMALCALSLDDRDKAERYTRLMLGVDPYYSPTTDDAPRFVDIVNSMKDGRRATITTASSQEENIEESPVPVTVITDEMIANCGAQNLKEVLLAYVPGMTDIDNNDDLNVAMRGAFSSGQEHILVLLNGHRMNSYATNTGYIDYSVSLEKIKQIEVLRGPASSLYGGVALSAVINVITKTGPDVDGFCLKGGIGNYGQLHGDFVFGKSYYDLNIFTWGSVYSANGEKQHINSVDNIFEKGGDYMIGEVKEKPAFDIGLMLTWKHLRLLYTTNNSKVTPPLTPNIYMMPYLSDHFTTIDGNTVGKNMRSHHFQLAYNNTFGRFDVGASFYYDNTSHMQYNVQAETSAENGISFFLPLPDSLTYILNKHNGVYTDFEARENNIGFHLKGDYHYVNNANHKGTISVGTHFSRFKLEDIRYIIGCDYNKIFYNAFNYKDFYKGTEYSNDAYIQVKHQWHNWILNAGLRYDYIRHYNDKKLNKYSPRATLIYLTPTWMVRFNYSHSFVDAPYLYRKSNDNYYNSMGYDEVTLEPQTLDSWQLSIGSPSLLKGLMLELNAFYNVTDNVIVNGINRYSNEDQLTVAGIELSANYSLRKFTSNLTASWLKPLNTGDGSSLRDHLYSIPEFSANLVMAYQLSNHFKAHTYICLYGEQYDMSLLDSHYNGFLDTRCIVNAGLSYNLKSVSFGLNIHNLLNTEYRQGGYSLSSIPQKGRWLMFDVAFRY